MRVCVCVCVCVCINHCVFVRVNDIIHVNALTYGKCSQNVTNFPSMGKQLKHWPQFKCHIS